MLEWGHTIIAGRLSGAFRNIGKKRIADDINHAMKSAGYDVRETDPLLVIWLFMKPGWEPVKAISINMMKYQTLIDTAL